MYTSISLKALASILSIASVVNGHMIMKTPIPYGRGSINNSPLAADGSDFPCKNIFTLTDPTNDVNHMAIGEAQTLSFTGSAVHGGGSCQVSLTTDLVPTKSSKWMVIKSIEGGCPADVAGNLPADPNGSGAATFQYTVPAGVSPGQYTIAWTWVNKIGNREFYMNCGRADITAAKKKRYAPAPKPGMSKRDSFPGLFVANLAGVSNGCATTEGVDIEYPNPGSVVQKSSDGSFGPPVGCSGSSGNTPAESPSAAAGGSAATSSAQAAGSSIVVASSSAAAASVTGGSSPGVFASGAAPQSSVVATTSAAAAATNSPAVVSPIATTATNSPAVVSASPSTATVSPVPAAASPSAASPSSGSSSTGHTQGSACSSEGDWYCAADGSSFQRCASGMWSASIPMAAGTTCTPGESANFQMKAVGAHKRAILPGVHGNLHHRRSLPVLI